jgi:hypothetical protein
LKNLIESGTNVLLIDLDGPPLDLYPQGVLVDDENLSTLKNLLNDPKYLFGQLKFFF